MNLSTTDQPATSRENPGMNQEIAEYILKNPEHAFEEYQKTLEAIDAAPKKPSNREVSIFYRTNIGNRKSPNFLYDQTCVSWLIMNIAQTIGSPTELVTAIEALSGLKTENLVDQNPDEITAESRRVSERARAQLPGESPDDNDISDLISTQADRGDN